MVLERIPWKLRVFTESEKGRPMLPRICEGPGFTGSTSVRRSKAYLDDYSVGGEDAGNYEEVGKHDKTPIRDYLEFRASPVGLKV